MLINWKKIPAGTNPKEGTLDEAIEMAETPITQLQWVSVMGELPDGISEYCPNQPVTHVSYNDCVEYCERYNAQYPDEPPIRLPTSVEWGIACRAESTTEYFFGDDSNKLSEYAVFGKNQIANVATCKPNQWGLYDMHGNVYEWTSTPHESQRS